MNKKFSTLLVSVLLASAFVGTAEAKMKTIAKDKAPEAGQYLVAQTFIDKKSAAQYLVGQDPTAQVTLSEAGAVTDMSKAWTLVKSGGKYYFKNAEGKYIGKVKNKKVTAVNSISDAVGFTFEKGKFKSGNAYLAVVITAGKLYVTIDALVDDVKALTLASLSAGGDNLVDEIGSDYYLVAANNAADIEGSNYLKYDGTTEGYTVGESNGSADFMWAIEKTTLNGKVVYKFTSAANPAYTIMFGANGEYNKGFNLYDVNFAAPLGNNFKAGKGETIFGVYETTTDYLAESDLNDILGNGFELTIDTKKDKKTTIEGASAFEGVLTATDSKATDGKKFRLTTADGKYVALDLNANWNLSSLDDKGLKFTTIKEGDLTKTDKYYTWFQIEQAVGAEETLKSISVLKAEEGDAYGVLRIATAADKNYLTVAAADNAQTAAPYLELGSMNVVDVTEFFATPSYYSITQVNKEGTKVLKVLGVDANETAAFINPNSVQQNMPEGQWAAEITEAAGDVTVKFVNRENGKVYNGIQSLRTTSTTTTLRAATPVYEAVVSTGAGTTATIYLTLVATPLASATATDGYEIWSQNDLRDEEYTLGFYSNVLGAPAYLAENHAGGHQLGLEKDVKDAAAWKLTAWTGKKSEDLAVTDSVYVTSTVSFWNPKKGIIGDWDTKTDSLKLVAYTITNVANGEPLYYSESSDTSAYICNPTKEAARFVIKKAANGMYNLIQVKQAAADKPWELSSKVYAGFSAKYGNMQNTSLTYKTENDLVVIEKKAAPEYVKLNMGDTIRIFREGAEASLLFEKGEFLGMENAFEFTKMAPAMYVDTAYVDRKDNNRYQYLLAVEPDRVITSEECTVPGHPKHETNVLHARFLVNLIDSAEVVKAANKIHGTNKYINSEKFAKLGFVPGYHAKDTLVINNSVYTGTKNAKNDTILMEKADYNVAKFAFKVVDQETKAFVIETLYKPFSDLGGDDKNGYLKWMNGAIVVVNDINNADVYNLKATDEDPTANEAIAAEANVKVIGGQGAVTVQGAAGKVITVANILGQTIANQVAASDNVTIAVPAGIVVVAVEGEATKVVVK